MIETNTTYFVGSGPGDPELITLRAKELLENADVIVYSGSLLNPKLLEYAKKNVILHDAALLNRNKIYEILRDSTKQGKLAIRFHDGDPALYSTIREQIDKLNVRNKISLHVRYIPETEIPMFFSAADVCLLPYRTATQSGIVGIAYHFDLPVIVTNVGGLAEMVEENKTGLIIDKANSDLISSSIKKYFSESSKTNFISHITEYKSLHSWQKIANEINSIVLKNK